MKGGQANPPARTLRHEGVPTENFIQLETLKKKTEERLLPDSVSKSEPPGDEKKRRRGSEKDIQQSIKKSKDDEVCFGAKRGSYLQASGTVCEGESCVTVTIQVLNKQKPEVGRKLQQQVPSKNSIILKGAKETALSNSDTQDTAGAASNTQHNI